MGEYDEDLSVVPVSVSTDTMPTIEEVGEVLSGKRKALTSLARVDFDQPFSLQVQDSPFFTALFSHVGLILGIHPLKKRRRRRGRLRPWQRV